MGKPQIDVLNSGAVILGRAITCDGFRDGHNIRVQTHVHQDHMKDFSTSLGGGREVIMSPETYQLLKPKHPDFEIRTNIHQLRNSTPLKMRGHRITLMSSDHLLGGVQVHVEDLKTGTRLGYSSDFNWPIASIIKVDELVVDATYGSPRDVRKFTQGQAEDAFIQLVRRALTEGPVHITALPGPAERSLKALAAAGVSKQFPIVGSEDLCRNMRVWNECGYTSPRVLQIGTKAAEREVRNNKYIRYWGYGIGQPNDVVDGISILLRTQDYSKPVKRQGLREYSVGLTNHADFNGTLKYIETTGAKFVVTDGHRSPENAETLAKQITKRLGIKARASSNMGTRAWGD